jgi:hypothetical protein
MRRPWGALTVEDRVWQPGYGYGRQRALPCRVASSLPARQPSPCVRTWYSAIAWRTHIFSHLRGVNLGVHYSIAFRVSEYWSRKEGSKHSLCIYVCIVWFGTSTCTSTQLMVRLCLLPPHPKWYVPLVTLPGLLMLEWTEDIRRINSGHALAHRSITPDGQITTPGDENRNSSACSKQQSTSRK